jgi:hypothetical protein
MKLHHLSILFVILALALFVLTDIKTNTQIAVSKEKKLLDQSFSRAIDDALIDFVEVEGFENLHINRESAVQNFFSSLYASLDIMDQPDKKELMKNYTPVIAIACEDGFYLNVSLEYKGTDNLTYLKKQWTDKIPFYYEDEDFIYKFTLKDTLTLYDKNGLLDVNREQTIFQLTYQSLINSELYTNFRNKRPDSFLLNEENFNLRRKACIIGAIEDNLSFYSQEYNNIAKQFGINYQYTIPVIDNSEWMRSIDNPCMIVLFQGYPLKHGDGETYNRYIISGAKIDKNHVFYLEQKEWFYLYHKDTCSELLKDELIIAKEPHYTILECVNKGAYACPFCNETGAYPPDYKP